MKNFDLTVVHRATGNLCPVRLSVSDLPGDMVLQDQGKEYVAHCDDAWHGLRDLQLQLERDGLLLCCNGSRANVRPSGMAAQMSGGFAAYLLTMGTNRRMPLVQILDPVQPSQVVPVAEQDRFYEQWLASLRESWWRRCAMRLQHPYG